MKKNILLMLVTLAILSACDSPRSQRALMGGNSSSGLTNGNIVPVNLNNGTTPTTPTTPGTNTGTPGSSVTIPADATQCKFSTDGVTGYETTSSHLGDYTLCHSSTDTNVFYFQLKTPPTGSNGDVSVCFIPTTSSGANSIYVGNPMCGYFKDPKAVSKITFIKYPQYSNATINGVLFFKDLSWYYPVYNQYLMTLDAYKICMNMLAYGNTAYCQSFKQVGQYVFKQF